VKRFVRAGVSIARGRQAAIPGSSPQPRRAWSDLVDFEVISVMSSAEAAVAFKRRDDVFSPAEMAQN